MTTIERPVATFASLREYLDVIREKGLLQDIADADWDLELGSVTELVALSKTSHALLFDRIKGYKAGLRVATNLYASPRLHAIALSREVESVDRDRLGRFLTCAPGSR